MDSKKKPTTEEQIEGFKCAFSNWLGKHVEGYNERYKSWYNDIVTRDIRSVFGHDIVTGNQSIMYAVEQVAKFIVQYDARVKESGKSLEFAINVYHRTQKYELDVPGFKKDKKYISDIKNKIKNDFVGSARKLGETTNNPDFIKELNESLDCVNTDFMSLGQLWSYDKTLTFMAKYWDFVKEDEQKRFVAMCEVLSDIYGYKGTSAYSKARLKVALEEWDRLAERNIKIGQNLKGRQSK